MINHKRTQKAPKKGMIALVALAFVLLIMLLAADRAHGNLTVTVSPGYQFPLDGSVPPTYQLWNELGTPTITISGTIGVGTNGSVTLQPNSVSGIYMVDAFPDGGILNLPSGSQTLGWNTASPRQLSVNTAGIVDSYSGLRSYHTNALEIFLDPAFFLLSSNSLGSTNYSTGNSGSVYTNYVTLQPHSLGDVNIAPGGISSASITNSGLLPSSLNTEQIFTNIFTISGGTATNTATNFNTVVVGNTNGLAEVVQMGPGLTISNVPTQFVFTTNTGNYTNTVNVPTLEFGGFNGSLPLLSNVGPWTNALVLPGLAPAGSFTSTVVNAYSFGGATPYTNYWTASCSVQNAITVTSLYVTNAAGTSPGTNGNQVVIVAKVVINGTPYSGLFWVSNTVYDASGQVYATPNPALFFFKN